MRLDYLLYSFLLLITSYFYYKFSKSWERMLVKKNNPKFYVSARIIQNRMTIFLIILCSVIFLMKSIIEK